MKTSRVSLVAVGALLSAVVGGCSQVGTDSTSDTRDTTTTITAVRPTPTTVDTPTTTSTATTLAGQGGATVDPNLPSASSAGVVWDEVGSGWYAVLYDSSRANPTSEADIREGPVVLYLANAAGERYEVAAWAAGQYPTLVDATSTSALVARHGANFDETMYELVDLTTGARSVPYRVGFPEDSLVDTWPHASLTRPSGENVVVHRADGTSEWLERRTPGGTVLSVIYEQPYIENETNLAWLYGFDGTVLVVAHAGGISEVTIEGSVLEELWAPPDTRCDPVRWWDADTFLAACYGQSRDSAPIDDYGNPHIHYGRLWLLETDGSEGSSLTDYPAESPIVDFGYHDAWPSADNLFLQWSGDCGASAVATLNPDGTGEFFEMTTPDDTLFDGIRMVDIHNGEMTLYGWQGCDGWIGGLFTSDLDGHYLNTLVPVIGDSRGVIGVTGLTTVYP